eukprot:11146787-Alexandrium_andersonii.AAC.1
MEKTIELCNAMRNWPKRCAILGAEGSQWPFMMGEGHNTLRNHLANIGELLVQQGIPVIHGRQLWNELELAPDGVRLRWELRAVFKVLYTLKTLANFPTVLPVLWHPPEKHVQRSRRQATHVHFKTAQIAFRDAFANGPKEHYRPPIVPCSRSDTKAGFDAMIRQR